MSLCVLVTGGAGYIGAQTCVELLRFGHRVVLLDNFSNSHRAVVPRIRALGGGELVMVEGDVCDRAMLDGVFAAHAVDAVIHFAGLKAVAESVLFPERYYRCNVYGSLTLAAAMQAAGVFDLVFSSSATVYGDPVSVPVPETARFAPQSPYGHSKAMVEQILTDLARADPRWHIALLRYFNPVGADPSGEIGEDPRGTPNNLLPYVAQVAIGRRPSLTIYGDDYETRDGTGERDYIHVVDLARGHLAALNHRAALQGAVPINLGRGIGSTVMEVVRAFEKVSGQPLAYTIGPRRAGDVARYFADPSLAKRLLHWQAEYDIERACLDAWRWQTKNPDGLAHVPMS